MPMLQKLPNELSFLVNMMTAIRLLFLQRGAARRVSHENSLNW